MDRGIPNLSIIVVPDSGTGELAGISGAFKLDIRDGVHYYNSSTTSPDASEIPRQRMTGTWQLTLPLAGAVEPRSYRAEASAPSRSPIAK